MKRPCTLLLFFSFLFPAIAQMENIPLLTVTGEAVVKTIPDYAVITVTVQRKVAATEFSGITANTLFNRENLQIAFIDKDSITSSWPQLSIAGGNFTFVKEFIIEVRNLSKLPEVLTELMKRDFKEISTVSYRSSRIEEIKNEARTAALVNARQKAISMARSLGQSIGKVHLVKERDVQVNNWYLEKNTRTSELLTESYISNPGYISVPAVIEVSFDLLK